MEDKRRGKVLNWIYREGHTQKWKSVHRRVVNSRYASRRWEGASYKGDIAQESSLQDLDKSLIQRANTAST